MSFRCSASLNPHGSVSHENVFALAVLTSGGGMRFLLTSAGVTNTSIHDSLVDLLGKPIGERDALCISPPVSRAPRHAPSARRSPAATPPGFPTASYGPPMAGPGRAWTFISGREPRTPM